MSRVHPVVLLRVHMSQRDNAAIRGMELPRMCRTKMLR